MKAFRRVRGAISTAHMSTFPSSHMRSSSVSLLAAKLWHLNLCLHSLKHRVVVQNHSIAQNRQELNLGCT